ncbi:MAG: hypothetical protein WC917_04590 [Bacilli bacterium]|jgi:hypothetical protein
MPSTGNVPIEYLENLKNSYESRVKILEEFLPLVDDEDFKNYNLEKAKKIILIEFLEGLIKSYKD